MQTHYILRRKCFSWFRRDTEHPNPQGFSDEEYAKLAGILAKRISSEWCNINNIGIEKIEHFPYVLSIWNEYGQPQEATNTIIRKIRRDKNFVFELLNSYTPTAFGEFGSRKSSFRKDNYDAIQKVVNSNVIVEAIKEVYNDLVLDDRYPEFLHVHRNEELARQFLWLHHKFVDGEANVEEMDSSME